MRLTLLLIALAVIAFAANGLNIPSSAFISLNCTWPTQYCAGYNMGASVAPSILPSAAGIATYDQYKNLFTGFYKPQSSGGFVIDANVGYDNALEDGANYEWVHDPLDGHNTVIQ